MTADTTHPSLFGRMRDLGDQVAWREFDERYRDLILRYAQRRGLQTMDAEDVRQLAVLTIARGIERFTSRPELGRFRDYLRTIVRNLVHQHFAAKGRRPEQAMSETLELLAQQGADRAQDEMWEEEWRLHHYRNAMAVVRQAMQPRSLAIFDGLLAGRSVDDVAREFDATPEAVYKVKQRVRDRLTEQVAAQVREESLPADGEGPPG